MENETYNQEEMQVEQKSSLRQVTPLSKYLAMALFIMLPFVGGYVGYRFAPEKVVEVEKEVIKEVLVEKAVESVEIEEVSDLAIVKEVESSYVYLPNDTGLKDEYKIFDGDISDNSILVSQDSTFIQFKGFPCSLRGGHCIGQSYVFDTTTETAHPIVLEGDENAPYNLDDHPSLAVWQDAASAYGKVMNWDDQSHLVYEVDYKDTTYTYRSVSNDEPWVLSYVGVAE